jgi:hypothetical protein
MNHLNRATKAAFGRCFLALISVCVLESYLPAAPMVYTGLVVTDVRVGTTLMHNASLKMTFEGDTNNLLQVPIASTACLGNGGNGYFLYLATGVARVEIEYQGRTRRARLQDGQVFVAVDVCNGGIGFGSFVGPNCPGPNCLEPAYPLAFTMGTAEYDSIFDGSPLTDALSVTGSAWSCIGYPPGGAGNLPGTANGECTPPDAYPLHSDIGNIFIYQPYYEGTVQIASNHSGSTNRGAFLVRPNTYSPLLDSRAPERESESGVVYTLQTVADGSIGNHAFYQALVTFRMVSSPRSVTTQPSPVDATKPLYENRGFATVTIDDAWTVINAVFAPGQVYVRYDTGAGVAGFGSDFSPTYPVALNCANGAYPSDNTYTVDCVQGAVWDYLNINDTFHMFRAGILAQLNDSQDPSPGVTGLPQSLSHPTLLTGSTHTCAGPYTIGPTPQIAYYFPGDLLVCGGPAPRGLHTSKGDLFLQDRVGGSLSLGNAAIVQFEAATDPGWDLANSGFLHVEVLKEH